MTQFSGGLWTLAHKQTQCAALAFAAKFDRAAYPNGLPNISAVLRGKNDIYDPRTQARGWTDNPALVLADYLVSPRSAGGYGATWADNIDEASVIAAANACDEMVAVTSKSSTFTALQERSTTFTAQTSPPGITIAADLQPWMMTGTRFRVSSTGSLPSGLSANTDYYAWLETPPYFIHVMRTRKAAVTAELYEDDEEPDLINISSTGSGTHTLTLSGAAEVANTITLPANNGLQMRTGTRFQVSSSGTLPSGLTAGTDYFWISVGENRGKVATSLANARAGVAISITNTGSGTHTLTRNATPRYTCNGLFKTDVQPRQIIQGILSSFAGRLLTNGRKFAVYAGVWQGSSGNSYSESDLVSGIKLTSLRPKRELFNGVKGVYIDPDQNWQEVSFPPVTSATYLARDNNLQTLQSIDLPFTDNALTAQRLAKITLERNARQIFFEADLKLGAMKNQATDVVSVNNDRLGFSGKTFEIQKIRLEQQSDERGTPYLIARMQAAETDANVYAWASSEGADPVPAARSNLPSSNNVTAPGAPVATESLYETQSGAGLKSKVALSWADVSDAFVVGYQVEYKPPDGLWQIWEVTNRTSSEITDLSAGAYKFRLKSINQQGATSAYSPPTDLVLQGLIAPPAAPTGLSVSLRSSVAQLRWNRAAELDVLNGGSYRLRWSAATSGATWDSSIEVMPEGQLAIAGNATEVTVPARTGTWLLRAADSSGNLSRTAASVSITQPSPDAPITDTTVSYHTSFTGTFTNCSLVSSEVVMDAGATDATWTSTTTTDLSAVYDATLSITSLTVSNYSLASQIDSITSLIDSWASFDDSGQLSPPSVWVEIRTTTDNPSGSPVWTDWRPLAPSFDARLRAFQTRLRFSNPDPTRYRAKCSALSVAVEMARRAESGSVATSAVADTTVTYTNAFRATPAPQVTVSNMSASDVVEITATSATSFSFNIRNAGSRVARNCNWAAAGYGKI